MQPQGSAAQANTASGHRHAERPLKGAWDTCVKDRPAQRRAKEDESSSSSSSGSSAHAKKQSSSSSSSRDKLCRITGTNNRSEKKRIDVKRKKMEALAEEEAQDAEAALRRAERRDKEQREREARHIQRIEALKAQAGKLRREPVWYCLREIYHDTTIHHRS